MRWVFQVALSVLTVAPATIALSAPLYTISRAGDELVTDGDDWQFGNSLSSNGTSLLVGSVRLSNPGANPWTYLFDAETGDLEYSWQSHRPVPSPTMIRSGVKATTEVSVQSGAAFVLEHYASCGWGYCAPLGGSSLRKYSLDSGELLWEIDTDSEALGAGFPGWVTSKGSRIATDGGIVLVGAPIELVSGIQTGVVFAIDSDTGQIVRTLAPEDINATTDYQFAFGSSIAVHDGRALIGAPGRRAAYLFDIQTGLQLAQFLLPDPSTAETDFPFITSVALHGNRAVILAEDTGGGRILAFDTTTFEEAYRKDDRPYSSNLLAYNSVLAVTELFGPVLAYDMLNGDVLGKQPVLPQFQEQYLERTLAMDDERLYVTVAECFGSNSLGFPCDNPPLGSIYVYPRNVPEPSAISLFCIALSLVRARASRCIGLRVTHSPWSER